ncbi:hypothetical protein [Collimonas arenae]|uniref:hypothetical protein n=1 Tax=Collimonas arenae TaxID=279058 RepID=UPI0012E055B1|nr:hypothetical protein [Collimonas arenae]
MSEAIKICATCKHKHFNLLNFILGYAPLCRRPSVGIDPVSGKINRRWTDQDRAWEEQCGKDGKYWEPKS